MKLALSNQVNCKYQGALKEDGCCMVKLALSNQVNCKNEGEAPTEATNDGEISFE